MDLRLEHKTESHKFLEGNTCTNLLDVDLAIFFGFDFKLKENKSKNKQMVLWQTKSI